MRDKLLFTYPWMFRRSLKKCKTILDVGSGKGEFIRTINYHRKFTVTGIELFDPYIKIAQQTGLYKQILKRDLNLIKLKKNSFDAVICNQVIEHFKKKDGEVLIGKIEAAARNIVIIATPQGHFHQDEYDRNILQKHLAHWQIKDFRKLGYTVRGQGLKIIYGEHGRIHTWGKIRIFRYTLYAISYLLSPVVYFFPALAAYIVATKKKTKGL